ncbi:Clavaminate synthase-like protein [Sparassis crispa]|uniref:Clavaminate synthase-like protein n=1 Tax=Sparassis crispa TaxID=139825 RepID=A0A401G9S0_9APHY|nr:Clavaminate synthase-like protein [Sparassis crispa]GBE78901.1 Clavaminate synthase-like protein [Sparassis crispa]
MPGLTTFPPFPDDVPTHPLLVVDFQLIRAGDPSEIDKLWKAATELGFWYLKNHGTDEEVNGMFEMGAETMALTMEEKMKYEQGDEGMSCGYKAAGASATDETGAKDSAEFINVAKDDALAWPGLVYRIYPSTVNARMESTIIPFVRKSVEVTNTLIDVLNTRLGLPGGALVNLHAIEEHSGSEARCIRTPPRPVDFSEDKATLGAHTDFGSLSFLHNRLGGLQVLVPGTAQWQYVRPIPGYAICNIGDALTIFSGGILRSNLHRVVPPPKDQGNYERWSLVFFLRPSNSIELRALAEQSQLIAETVSRAPAGKFQPGSTAKEWFARRVKYQRVKNRTGPETWRASRGMEHAPAAI